MESFMKKVIIVHFGYATSAIAAWLIDLHYKNCNDKTTVINRSIESWDVVTAAAERVDENDVWADVFFLDGMPSDSQLKYLRERVRQIYLFNPPDTNMQPIEAIQKIDFHRCAVRINRSKLTMEIAWDTYGWGNKELNGFTGKPDAWDFIVNKNVHSLATLFKGRENDQIDELMRAVTYDEIQRIKYIDIMSDERRSGIVSRLVEHEGRTMPLNNVPVYCVNTGVVDIAMTIKTAIAIAFKHGLGAAYYDTPHFRMFAICSNYENKDLSYNIANYYGIKKKGINRIYYFNIPHDVVL